MNICAVSDETYDCWKDYVKGELNVILNNKTTESFSFLIIFVIFVIPVLNKRTIKTDQSVFLLSAKINLSK